MKNVALVLSGLVAGALLVPRVLAEGPRPPAPGPAPLTGPSAPGLAPLTGPAAPGLAPLTGPAAPGLAHAKWQQFCEPASSITEASTMAGARGAEGWELIGFFGGALCFKRPMADRPQAGVAGRPSAGVADRPSAGVADRPSAGVADRPSAGVTDRPSAGVTGVTNWPGY
jgi:hypothetical protein